MNHKFEMSGKEYRTDKETLEILRSIVPAAKETGDTSAVAAIMAMGIKTGRIVEA